MTSVEITHGLKIDIHVSLPITHDDLCTIEDYDELAV